MEKPKIDFLGTHAKTSAGEPAHGRFFRRVVIGLCVFCAVIGAVFSYEVVNGSNHEQFPTLSIFTTLSHLVTSGDRLLKGESADRVNFLLLGIGGEGHDGPELTDTIIFASVQPSTGKIGLISIPRDLTVPIPNYGWKKINSANAYGEAQEAGTGPALTSQVVQNVLGQETQYYVRVDFDGFAKLVDDVGGIDVFVDKAFSDDRYPILGKEDANCGETTSLAEDGTAVDVPVYDCRFELIVFKEGWMHMDGLTALKYVRSRHGSNGEGSDFARARRQQKVLLAVRDRVMSASTFLNPARLNRIFETLQKNISTNLETWEIIRLAQTFKNLDTKNIVSRVLDASPDSPLYATSLNGAYVLLPKNDDWGAVQQMAADIFAADGTVPLKAGAPEQKPQFARLEIQNGTRVSGLGFRTSQLLDGQGFDVVKVGNAVDRAYTHTVIYDLTNGARPEELKTLRDFLKADVTLSATGWLVNGDIIPKQVSLSSDDYEKLTTERNIDFLVILGENSANLVRK